MELTTAVDAVFVVVVVAADAAAAADAVAVVVMGCIDHYHLIWRI